MNIKASYLKLLAMLSTAIILLAGEEPSTENAIL